MRVSSTAWRIAVRTGLLIGTTLAVIQLSGVVEPVELLAPGRDGQGSEVMLRDFGPDKVPERIPFDGQYLYVTARLLPDLDAIVAQVEESSYRLVRIVHPLLAAPAPAGTPTAVALQAWNVVGVALVALALADILERHGSDARLAATAAPAACILPLILTTSEALAFGLGLCGLSAADRRRPGQAVALLAVAGLTRESALTIAIAAGAVVALDQGRRRHGLALVAGSTVPTLLWWAYVQTITERSRVPVGLLGIVHLGDRWWVDIVATIIALGLMAVSVLAWRDVRPLHYVAVAFLVWIPLYEEYAFKVVGIPRLSLPSIALGIAGALRLRARGDAAGHGSPIPQLRE